MADLEALRNAYEYRLEPVDRCESCVHSRPTSTMTYPNEGRCTLLEIVITNVRKSRCPGWQTGWDQKGR